MIADSIAEPADLPLAAALEAVLKKVESHVRSIVDWLGQDDLDNYSGL